MVSATDYYGTFFTVSKYYSPLMMGDFSAMLAWRLHRLCDMNKSLRVAIINSGALSIAVEFALAVDSCVEMMGWRNSYENASLFRKLEKMEFPDTPSNAPWDSGWVVELTDSSPPDWNETPDDAFDVEEEHVQYLGGTLDYFVHRIDAALEKISELGKGERAAVILTGARELAAKLLVALASLSADFDVAGCGIAPVSLFWPQLDSCKQKYPLLVTRTEKNWQAPNAWTKRPPPVVYDLSNKYWVWEPT